MTVDDYYAAAKRLGRPSNVPTVYLDKDGMPFNVPDPKGMTPEQREETMSRIRENLGIGFNPTFPI